MSVAHIGLTVSAICFVLAAIGVLMIRHILRRNNWGIRFDRFNGDIVIYKKHTKKT